MALVLNSAIASFASANFVSGIALAIAVLNTLRGGQTADAPGKSPLPNISIALNPIVTILALLSWALFGFFVPGSQVVQVRIWLALIAFLIAQLVTDYTVYDQPKGVHVYDWINTGIGVAAVVYYLQITSRGLLLVSV